MNSLSLTDESLIPNILQIIEVAKKAGEAVMGIYSQSDYAESCREDFSPITLQS